jgi:hypothetical protein
MPLHDVDRPLMDDARFLVGLPFKVQTWFITVLIRCTCQPDDAPPLLLIGQPGSALGACPECHRKFVLQRIRATDDGQLTFSIAAETKAVVQ